MGRLFWKFFTFILLVQLLVPLSIGVTFWLKDRARDKNAQYLDMGPPAVFMINAAAATLRFDGTQAFADFEQGNDGRHRLYAIDASGHDLLGRTVNADMVQDARRVLAEHDVRPVVRMVTAANGLEYLLLLSDEEQMRGPPRGFGPGPGPGLFFFGKNPHSSQEFALHELMPVVMAVIASLIFAALLAWYFSKPIRTLRLAFKAVAGGNLDTKVGPDMGPRRDELADLGRDFDSMAGQLRDLMDGQRRLLHDVSHELRSPLARMQAAIGLARQQPDKVDVTLERIERESIRMDKLVDELLTLSRLESGVAPALSEEIHIDEIIREVVDDARFEATAKGCAVEWRGDGKVSIDGQPELIHRAIENVVRNAVRHTAAGSSVILQSKIDFALRELSLAILDHGPGAPEQLLTAIFAPFFRGESGASNPGGSGLGLAIAQRVVEMHGGVIRASNRPEGGLCVEIRLPFSVVR
ncbi:ATP-binding protein [Herbaspirillum sp. RTI4]|uniref:ATP-binding protein n=1 Tax=Herbaspirillum sp. RTI4 TaxID=3048640 RepID=UPI002AB4EF55|nr:ATP-binding protein [Herbaspirillum sp. RTI4]MDY7578155.1 ATP-binding protein [Herbaspirillum sp. RTI4]MEA9980744.1 ATP-binding protein [Herbaspirillum sp. RTI4]